MSQLLSNICDYINEKIPVNDLSDETYVSTENMMPNKAGIVRASTLPNLRLTPAYCKNDILISNIRPYFKKIWQAEYSGGCSNDVLVIRAKQSVNPKFLYYVLSEDKFFDYATVTAKGTKMPRGDKSAIMKYKVPEFSETEQEKIANILSPIDEKITINSATNNNLEQQAMALFNNKFENINNGNKCIGDYIKPKRGKNLLSKDAINGDVPVVAGGLTPATYHNVSNTKAPVITISASGANAGYVNLWNIPVWSSDSSFIDYNMTANVYFWYVLLKRRQQEIFDSQTGSAQPHIYPQHIEIMPVSEINKESMYLYTKSVTPLFKLIGCNLVENSRLTQLRDTLLPKLMSGEIDVSNIKIDDKIQNTSADKLSFSVRISISFSFCLFLYLELFSITIVISINEVTMKKFLLTLFTLFLTASFGLCTTNSYDQYGQKTGSFNKNGSTINQYDKYGTKTGSFKQTANGYNSYDRYGAKTGSYKKSGNTTTQYDRYGAKVGTYKTDSNGITTKYDKYGAKTGSFKKDSSGRITEYDKYGRKVGSYK